jgi:CubicO group peptidase (beta-lactamase class C family)
MNESEPLVSSILGKPNVAIPHAEIGDSVRTVPVRSTDGVAPAGSVWSSVFDMSKWMRVVLDSGRAGTTRLVTPATFIEMVTPQIRAPLALYPALQLTRPHGFSYGLGWFIEDYQGQTVWMHTGSIDGMSAIIGLMPDQRVGVYVLANLDHAELRHALMYRVFDLYAGNPARDWSADLYTLFHPVRSAAAAGDVQPKPGRTPPSLPLDRYAGTYADSTYGTIEVKVDGTALQARFGNDDLGVLDAFDYDTFRSKSPPPSEGSTTLTFLTDGAGHVVSVRVFGVTFLRAGRGRGGS